MTEISMIKHSPARQIAEHEQYLVNDTRDKECTSLFKSSYVYMDFINKLHTHNYMYGGEKFGDEFP